MFLFVCRERKDNNMIQDNLDSILSKASKSTGGIVRKQEVAGKFQYAIDSESTMPESLTLFEMENPDVEQWYDVFHVMDCTKTKDAKMHVGALLALTYSSSFLELEAVVYDKETQEKIDEFAPVIETNTAVAELDESRDIPQGFENKELICVVKGIYEDENGKKHELLKPSLFAFDIKDYIDYHHIRPIKEEKCIYTGGKWQKLYSGEPMRKVNDRVVISYLRTPKDVSDCDYVCNFERGEGTDHPIVGIPFHATLRLKQEGYFSEPVTGRGWIQRMDSSQSGGKPLIYEDRLEHSYGKSGDTKVEIDEDKGWGVVYKEESMEPVDFQFYYDMHGKIVSGNGEDSVTIPWSTSVTSDINQTGCLYSGMKPLRIMWGCLAQDTLVSMGNGFKRKIQNVRVGEYVMTQNGKARVMNSWSGRGDNMMCLTMEDKSCLFLTADHPVCTTSGWKKAKEIVEGELLVREQKKRSNLEVKVVKVEKAASNNVVYNLSTKGKEHEFFAEGILVGDMERENGRV